MIRRPMLFAACAAAAAVMLSFYAGSAAAAIGAAMLSAWLIFHGNERAAGNQPRSKSRRAAWLFLVCFCLGALAYWHEDRLLAREADSLCGSSLLGEITDCTEKTSRSGDPCLQLTIKTEQGLVAARYYERDPDGAGQSYRNGEQALEGCVAELTGELKEPGGRRNPGCFDYALYLKSLGITKTVTCDAMTVHPCRPFAAAPRSFIRNRVCKVRESFLRRLAGRTDRQTAAMMRAIMFGDKGGLDEEMLETFQKNGTAHILAVSGLHIGIIYAFILKLWRGRRRWAFFGFNMTFFILYAAAAGFSPSVTRAVVMVLLHTLAGIRGWRYDLSSAAFAVALAVILRNPFMLFNTGFQMSFLAVLTLTLILPYIRRFYTGVFLASLAVQIGLGPFILYQFNYFSFLTVLINVPVVALAGLIVPAGLAAMVFEETGFYARGIADEAVQALCRIMAELNEAGQAGGISTAQIPSPPLWCMAFYYAALLLFATEEGRLALIRAAHKGKYVLKTVLLILLVSAAFQAFASDGFSKCDITFVDVGQGDCMHLRIDDGSRLLRKHNAYHVLIDGGGRDGFDVGKQILRPYLLKNGVGKIDLAIVTHLHNDHYDGIRSLCRMGMVERLCVYEGYKTEEKQILSECSLERDDLIYAAAGDVFTLGDASFTMLAPPALTDSEYARLSEEEEDENKKSLLIKTEYHEVTVMMTGDIGEEGEQAVMVNHREQLDCDILKVGHHGSRTSSCEQFLDAVSPAVAVIQVGENNMYGHPSPETLQRLSDTGASVYRNDRMGAIGFELGTGKIRKAVTIKKQQQRTDFNIPI